MGISWVTSRRAPRLWGRESSRWIRWLTAGAFVLAFPIAAVIVLNVTGCSSTNSTGGKYGTPNIARFDSIVCSPALRNKLASSTICTGMPHFVASDFLGSMISEPRGQVAFVGSNQVIGPEKDATARDFSNTDATLYRETYKTPKGVLTIWYRKPDFYLESIKAFDSLFFNCDSVRIVTALLDHDKLKLNRGFGGAYKFGQTRYFGEVHRWKGTPPGNSYWYALTIPVDSIVKSGVDFEFVDRSQIVMMELDGNRCDTFEAK